MAQQLDCIGTEIFFESYFVVSVSVQQQDRLNPISIISRYISHLHQYQICTKRLFVLQLAKDLLHPRPEEEQRRHKLKRLVQHPNSYFMDVKCPGCYKITTVFSHAQTVVLCVGCSTVLCQPTGGRARLTEGKYLMYNYNYNSKSLS